MLHRCCYAFFSQSLSIVLLCGSQLLTVIFSFSSARCILWPGFALIRLSCRCVIEVMLLHCVCCTWLIRTRIIICSVNFHRLQSAFDIPELRLQLIQSLKYQGVERSILKGVSCRLRLVCVSSGYTSIHSDMSAVAAHRLLIHVKLAKRKRQVLYDQKPPSGESTTTECGVNYNYQLVAVMLLK